MTSDFDNDEIKDSVFPVEFSDESASLDMYGVWVKSGPRDAPKYESYAHNSETLAQDLSTDFLDITELPDLPDFTDSSTPQETALDQADLDSGFDTINTKADVLDDELSLVESETADESFTDFNLVEDDNFFDVPPTQNDSSTSVLSEDTEISLDEYTDSIDELSTETEEIHLLEEEALTGAPQSDAQSVEIETVSFENLEPFEFEDSPLEEVEIFEQIKEKTTSEAEILPSDEDFSSFLDDLNSGEIVPSEAIPGKESSATDDLDLDSFIDSFNESGGTAHDEKAKVFDDSSPVDLDLDFDESFIADSEKIKATGSAVSESEFFNSEFGVEMIDESTSSDSTDFDSMFAGVSGSDVRENDMSFNDTSKTGMEDTDEFNDLLQSLEIAPTPAQAKKTKSEPVIQKKAYDLVVTDEEGFESLSSTVNDTVSDDDIEVPLFNEPSVPSLDAAQTQPFADDGASLPPTSPAASFPPMDEEFLDIPDIKDYNKAQSGLDTETSATSIMEENVSLDFDDISAVEKELNDFTPDTGDETVVTNDKSTELLMVIADELSSIKQELSTLKQELAGFKASGFTNDQVSTGAEPALSDNSGFFSDDDTDETIALTGDELNNILITADFTEEKSEDTDISTDFENSDLAQEIEEEEITEIRFSPETESHFDEIEPEIPDTLPDSIFEQQDMNVSIPIEVAHVNKLEDDVSYLEGSETGEPSFDDVAIEEPELEIIDFDDEKLEEPELTEFNIDLAEIENDFPAQQEVTKPQNDADAVPQDTSDFNVDFDDITSNEPEVTPEIPKNDTSAETESPVPSASLASLPVELKDDIKSVLSYMDQLLESLPEAKIEEFARSEHFEVYKKLFEELGIS